MATVVSRVESDGPRERPLTIGAVCRRLQDEFPDISISKIRYLEDYGLLEPAEESGKRLYPERDVEVVTACLQLARYGVEPRNLRPFKTGAEQEAAKLEQIVAPKLRSHNPDRHQAGLEDLQTLAALSQELSQLLFWRAVRSLVRP